MFHISILYTPLILVETLLYTSGIWKKAVKLLRVTVEFESNTTRAESPSGV